MPSRLTLEQKEKIRTLLELGWSFSRIKGHIKKSGFDASKSKISLIKNRQNKLDHSNESRGSGGRPSKLNAGQLNTLRRWFQDKNPRTQKSMALDLGVTERAIRYYKTKFGFKLIKKPRCHAIDERTIELRRKRSWGLYRMLKCGRHERIVTSDEAWFYLEDSNGKRDVQYIKQDQTRKTADVISKVMHKKGIMIWMAFCVKGVVRPYFIKPGAKVDASYYVKRILKRFIKDIKKFYPENNYIFQQDSAPVHTAKLTLEFLDKNLVTFIRPHEWMPNSPDCAPCDFWLWVYMKSQLKKKKVKSIEGLKKAIKTVAKNIPLDMIERAMLDWPK